MRIGGLQPVTLLDYPQKVAAIIFTTGCNMRCPFCYNPDLVLDDLIAQNREFDYSEMVSFLVRRKKYLDALVVTGGEPTLQPGLLKFLKKMKKIGYLIKLDTNGLNYSVLEILIKEGLIDYLAIDIKGSLAHYQDFCGLAVNTENIERSIALVKQSGLDYEFRSTLVKGLHRKNDILAMAQAIGWVKKYFLQNFDSPGKLVSSDFSGRPFGPKEREKILDLVLPIVGNCQWR